MKIPDTKKNIANMDYDELAKLLQERAKAMMKAKSVQSAVVFGTLGRRFADAAREIDTYAINEAAIANMIQTAPTEAAAWADKKMEALTSEEKK